MQKLPAITAERIHELASKGFQVRIIHYNPDLLDIRMDPDSTHKPVAERMSPVGISKTAYRLARCERCWLKGCRYCSVK